MAVTRLRGRGVSCHHEEKEEHALYTHTHVQTHVHTCTHVQTHACTYKCTAQDVEEGMECPGGQGAGEGCRSDPGACRGGRKTLTIPSASSKLSSASGNLLAGHLLEKGEGRPRRLPSHQLSPGETQEAREERRKACGPPGPGSGQHPRHCAHQSRGAAPTLGTKAQASPPASPGFAQPGHTHLLATLSPAILITTSSQPIVKRNPALRPLPRALSLLGDPVRLLF